jgi:hypothetical protein
MSRIAFKHVAAIGSGKIAEPQGGAIFWNVNINTAAAGAILKIYNNVSAVAADLICQIDCGATGSFWFGIYCQNGIFYDLSVGNPDVTIGIA